MNEYEIHRKRGQPRVSLIAMIEDGEEVMITQHGDPVAVCLPIDEYEGLRQAPALAMLPGGGKVFDFNAGEVRDVGPDRG